MCARVQFNAANAGDPPIHRTLMIRPGGAAVAAAELTEATGETPLIDVRHQFKSDNMMPGDKDWKKLAHLCRVIHEQITANDLVRVQCKQGRSRSVRTVAAYLMLYRGRSIAQVIHLLSGAFAAKGADCAEQGDLAENNVRNWLEYLQTVIGAIGLDAVKAG
ncbi:MAG: hypothetical protein AAGI89_11580 [Pseudomonadota bacterium]